MIVDDQELMRRGLAMVIGSQPDLELVAEAADGQEALEVLAAHAVDVVVMDVRMPVLDGVTTTQRIQHLPNPPKVLVLTTFDLDENALGALRAGASAFLLKDAPGEEIVAAIHHVHRGDSIIAPATTKRLIGRLVNQHDADPARVLDRLTEREQDVLRELARGASNAEIGARLYLSETTVKTHVGRILAKFGLRDRVQAVVLAYEAGVVRPGEH